MLSAKVATDASGRSKGNGFVQFYEPEAAEKAIEGLHMTQLCGQRLFVGPFIPAKVITPRQHRCCKLLILAGLCTAEASTSSKLGREGTLYMSLLLTKVRLNALAAEFVDSPDSTLFKATRHAKFRSASKLSNIGSFNCSILFVLQAAKLGMHSFRACFVSDVVLAHWLGTGKS